MKPRAISPRLQKPVRSLFTVLVQQGVIQFDFDDWCDTRLTCRDFIAECAHADGHHHPRSNWREMFFKLLRKRLSRGEKFQDALDNVGYGDCMLECELLAMGAEEEDRAERDHERYCRTMAYKGSGW